MGFKFVTRCAFNITYCRNHACLDDHWVEGPVLMTGAALDFGGGRYRTAYKSLPSLSDLDPFHMLVMCPARVPAVVHNSVGNKFHTHHANAPSWE